MAEPSVGDAAECSTWAAVGSSGPPALWRERRMTLPLHSAARSSPHVSCFLCVCVFPLSPQDRLERELERNLALRVEPGQGAESFEVSGRG